jgi:hypothetical protein
MASSKRAALSQYNVFAQCPPESRPRESRLVESRLVSQRSVLSAAEVQTANAEARTGLSASLVLSHLNHSRQNVGRTQATRPRPSVYEAG